MNPNPCWTRKYSSRRSVLLTAFKVLLVIGSVSRLFADEGPGNSAYRSVFTSPPQPLPLYEQLDAPLMGNGDMAAALCGGPENQQFWLSKNDLWELRPVWCRSGPRPLGHLDIQMPHLTGATYHVEQNLRDATTVSIFKTNKSKVTMRSWVSATENLLVVELIDEGAPVDGDVHLWIPAQARTTPQSDHRPKHGTASDWVGAPSAQVSDNGSGTFWGIRAFRDDVAIPAAAVCAFHLQNAKGEHFTLRPGFPATLVASMKSQRQSANYVTQATRRVSSLNKDDLATLYEAHKKWWQDFWNASSVELGDPELEWRYNVSNYILGSCSRDPDYPPGIAGTWVTTDQPMWTGAYTLNYNHEACFYGLYSSNHIEQADPEDAPALAFRSRGEYYARAVLNCRGVLYPVKIGPVGVETTGDAVHPNSVTKPNDAPWLRQKGGLFLGQRSDAAFAAVNIAQRWYTTYDLDYGRKVYPFVRDIALFWEDYLKFEPTPPALIKATAGLPEGLRQPADGRYVIYKDGANEGGQDTNSIISLAFIRTILKLSIDLSTTLDEDEKERGKWHYILAHLSAYPTQVNNGKTIFRRTEIDNPPRHKISGVNTSVAPIYPGGAVDLGSDPKLLEISRNTIATVTNWTSLNGESSLFPSAVRAGYDPGIVLAKLHEMAFQPNGIVVNPMHMLENSSIVPNTIDEMLMQSHDGVIRLFPVWPKQRDARFHTLRAYGAFLVSAALSSGQVKDVTILSEKGRPCTVQNPWPGFQVNLIGKGKTKQTISGNQLKFDTAPGDEFSLVPPNPERK